MNKSDQESMSERELVASYVAREGSCEPDEVHLINADEGVAVYKVTVKAWHNWTVPPPPYWLVVPWEAMNLYRGDSYLPTPWRHEQDEVGQADYVRSMHVGVITRLGARPRSERKQRLDA